MAIGAGQVTRLGISGSIWSPVGDFSTKSAGAPAAAGFTGSLSLMGMGISYFGITVILKMLMEMGYGF